MHICKAVCLQYEFAFHKCMLSQSLTTMSPRSFAIVNLYRMTRAHERTTSPGSFTGTPNGQIVCSNSIGSQKQ
jgi:hypothetical protein